MASSDRTVQFEGVTPILRVADLAASLAFYTEALGFAIQWREGTSYAAVQRGAATLMLSGDDQGHAGTWVYFGIDDADAFHEELLARSVAIRHPPTNYPWGARELQVVDPDGHVLRFGSEATGRDFGAWRDAAGRLWWPQPDGGWRTDPEA